MTPEELILKSSLHFGIDVSVPSAFGKGAFQERCMTTYYAIKELHMPYKDLSLVMSSDNMELRLMWLYAEGNMGVVQSRNRYKEYISNL
jgi:hypothetical protein|tara:strand:- start:552 stop:818 length:267 start_codon:yes stop_codon:yes gene_type:complete